MNTRDAFREGHAGDAACAMFVEFQAQEGERVSRREVKEGGGGGVIRGSCGGSGK
jgi:hypothetical protein